MNSDDFSKQNRLNSKGPTFYPLVVGIYSFLCSIYNENEEFFDFALFNPTSVLK